MPARRSKRVQPASRVAIPTVDDAKTSRALSILGDAVEKLQGQRGYDLVEGVNLKIGKNAVSHRLGRAPKVVLFTPTVADAAFAYAVDRSDERQVFITLVGVAQPGVNVFLM